MSGEDMVYLYKVKRVAGPSFKANRLVAAAEEADPTPLTGKLHGKRATDIEERFGRALDKLGLGYGFQVVVPTLDSRKVVDFVVRDGVKSPVEVDGPLGHTTAAKQGKDAVREMQLNRVFRERGWRRMRRVKWWRLESQAMADRVVREMFG